MLKFVTRRVRAGMVGGALVVAALVAADASAQGAGETGVAVGRMDAGTFRTVAEMEAFDAATPQPLVSEPPPEGNLDSGQARPTSRGAARAGSQSMGAAGDVASTRATTLGALNCESFGQLAPLVGNHFPPNPHGAVGANHFGHVVNSAIRFYSKALTGSCPTSVVINSSLAAFFGYATEPLFGARLIYDLAYGRFIVSAAAMPESGTVQKHFVAVSKDSDPLGGFFVNSFNATSIVGSGNTWNFPQVGYDEEAVILTANKHNSTPLYVGSTVVFLPKHRLYAGLSFDFSSFNDDPLNVGTISPPIVLDQGPYTVLAAADISNNRIRLTKWVGTSRVPATLIRFDDVSTSMTAPPLAQQPGSGPCPAPNCLDTGDGRLASQGTQSGASPVKLWQVRTDSDSGFPTPLTYRIDASTNAIEESCEHFASVSSYDFNPSIVADTAGTYFVTWTSTDPVTPSNVQIRVTSKKAGDACTVAQAGVVVVQSANPLTNNSGGGIQRWGEYSGISLDPADGSAWGVNEKVRTGSGDWKTQIFRVTNP